MHAQKPKFGPFFANLFQSFSLALFLSLLPFLFISSFVAHLSLFCMELWLANFLGKGQIDLQRVVHVCKQRNWQLIWKFGKLTPYFCIKSIFWTITTVFIFVKVCIYGHRTRQPKLKRDWNMILNSRCELFLKTGMFLRAFQKFSQNVQKKIKKA